MPVRTIIDDVMRLIDALLDAFAPRPPHLTTAIVRRSARTPR
jgi:hypothetical protein